MPAGRGLFITGVDTGVGKTWLGVRLARALHAKGLNVQPRKPVETGCEVTNTPDGCADAVQYWRAIGQSIEWQIICPYRFHLPAAPPQAAVAENRSLTLAQLIQACQTTEHAFAIIEGAGGFYSPIADDGLNADLAAALRLDILLVAADRLGAINHTLLTAEAIANRGLNLRAVILNQTKPPDPDQAELGNLKALQSRLPCPVLATNHDTPEIDWTALA